MKMRILTPQILAMASFGAIILSISISWAQSHKKDQGIARRFCESSLSDPAVEARPNPTNLPVRPLQGFNYFTVLREHGLEPNDLVVHILELSKTEKGPRIYEPHIILALFYQNKVVGDIYLNATEYENKPYWIPTSGAIREFQNKGLGTLLYLAAAGYLLDQHGLLLASRSHSRPAGKLWDRLVDSGLARTEDVDDTGRPLYFIDESGVKTGNRYIGPHLKTLVTNDRAAFGEAVIFGADRSSEGAWRPVVLRAAR